MPTADKVVAIACSDIHLSHTPPIARAQEPNWYESMGRVLNEVCTACQYYDAPLLIAGDIFDKWNPPPELINFAMTKLPKYTYAIPGQHDLKHHSLADLRKTAYYTLVRSGRIKDMSSSHYPSMRNQSGEEMPIHMVAVPWGGQFYDHGKRTPKDHLKITLAHAYIWTDGCSYPNAPKESNYKEMYDLIGDADIAIFGDNHKGFTYHEKGKPAIINCGALIRRKSDEVGYKPGYYIIYRDGSFRKKLISIEKDFISEAASNARELEEGISQELLGAFNNLQIKGLDFIEAIREVIKKGNLSNSVSRMAEEIIDEAG